MKTKIKGDFQICISVPLRLVNDKTSKSDEISLISVSFENLKLCNIEKKNLRFQDFSAVVFINAVIL